MAHFIKRVIDIVGALCLLLLSAPLWIGAAVLVRIYLGSPVLFVQVRPGLREKPFKLCKFRTMRDACDANGEPLPDADRMTRLGSFLRRTSIDELPQLWNVLKGELSLVGPRPLLTEYLELYSPTQQRRHNVKPGITGWAQVHGRNNISWEDRLQLDVWYADHWSLGLDCKILWKTVSVVLTGSGVQQTGNATMEKFRGNPSDSGASNRAA